MQLVIENSNMDFSVALNNYFKNHEAVKCYNALKRTCAGVGKLRIYRLKLTS